MRSSDRSTKATVRVLSTAAALLLGLLALALIPSAASSKAGSGDSGGESGLAAASVKDPLNALKSPGDMIKLSDEAKVTRWAHTQKTVSITKDPAKKSKGVGKLSYLTEDGEAEVYMVLDAEMDKSRQIWLHIRVPKEPNGTTGWVPEAALSQLYIVTTQLIIDRNKLTATLYKGGKKIFSAPVGVGKSSTPTPSGHFWIRELLKGDGDVYGSWAFGTAAYASISDWPGPPVVGIHGTNEPNLIPGRPSHGCVRLKNNDINKLKKLMPIGTAVLIR